MTSAQHLTYRKWKHVYFHASRDELIAARESQQRQLELTEAALAALSDLLKELK